MIWLVASYIFFLRFPNNYNSPNFFGEDGSIFTANYVDHGFWGTLLQTFNGYYIWGIYLLVELGHIFNTVFHQGQFINLPVSYAVVSYGFWGLCAALPIVLLRSYLRWPYLVLLAALICFVPAPGWDYQIIGTFGNFKFIYVYIAFLLILYRLRINKNSWKVVPVDVLLLICGYTNVTVYPMLLLLLLPYRHEIKQSWKQPLVLLRHNKGLISLTCLGIALVPQLIVIKVDGIPKVPGYLYGPFDHQRAVEILLHRPYLYSVTHAFTKHMTDFLAIGGFAIFLLIVFLLRSRRTNVAVVFGLATICLTTALFVINRPGVSQFFFGYKAGGPAQFFFTQNMIFYVVAVILLSSLIAKLRPQAFKAAVFLLFAIVVLGQFADSSSFGRNDFMQRNVGTIYANARQSCSTQHGNTVSFPIYPTKTQVYTGIDRSMVCTPALNDYQPTEIDLGLDSTNAQYLALGSDPQSRFTQTFVSSQPKLNGIDLYVSTFATTISTPYRLQLYDQTCHKLLRSVNIAVSRLDDNQYTNITFSPLNDSTDKTYCFTVAPKVSHVTTPIAVWLSTKDYPQGTTTVGGKQVTTDVVFRPLYNPQVR